VEGLDDSGKLLMLFDKENSLVGKFLDYLFLSIEKVSLLYLNSTLNPTEPPDLQQQR
jgi:hypothetical protein